MNLNKIVRAAINAVNADVTFYLYQATDAEEVDGFPVPRYLEPVELTGQLQNANDAALTQAEGLNVNVDEWRLYFDTSDARTLDRHTARPGDMVLIDDRYFLITSVQDDFRGEGWICAHITLQSREILDTEIVSTETE